MRAVVLSDEQNINFLNENFINTWVSNFELERTPNKKTYMGVRREQGFKPFDRMHPLVQGLMKGWKKHSPSDSLILSPNLELMGSESVNEFIGSHMIQRYLTFLKDALDGKLPGLAEETPQNSDVLPIVGLNLVLTLQKSEQESLSIFRTPESGLQDYTVIEIDTTAFKDGGVLIIDILVGSAEPMGSFDLYDNETELPSEGIPHDALASAWDVRPGERGRIEYRFEQGQVFKLGGTGSWFSEEGSVNAFFATISVTSRSKEDKY